MRNLITIITLVVLLAAAVSGFIFYSQLKQHEVELASIKERIISVKQEINQTKEKISSLEQENSNLEESIEGFNDQINSYRSQIVELSTKKEKIIYDLQNRRVQLSSLNKELQNLTAEKNELQVKLDAITSQHEDLNGKIVKLADAKRQLEQDIKKYIKPGTGITLDKIVVKLSNAPKANIVEVSNKYGYAIIDAGSEDGLIVGDELDVYRNDELVSRVIVEKIFQDASSIVPAEGFSDVNLLVDDKVCLAK